MEEAELAPPRLGNPAPVLPRGIEQLEGPQNVGVDEGGGVVDRAVHVRLGGEVDDGRRAVFGDRAIDRLAVGDVAADEDVVWVAGDGFERVEIARVGQFVEIDDPRGVFGDALPDEATADEARAAGDEDGLHVALLPLTLRPGSQQVSLGKILAIDGPLAGQIDCHFDPDAVQVAAHERPNVSPSQAA